ncbi:MAG: spermidine synthase [Myxococcales bacterium]|nr:spermidine synthase [Myxococcales bacterium]
MRGMSVGETIDRRVTPDGHEIALIKRGDAFEIVYDGNFLMASDCRRSERSLAELAMTPLSQRNDVTVLVAGLGMGHTLRAVLDAPVVVRVDVLEISDTVVEWNREHFRGLNGDALADPRVHLHTGDLLSFLRQLQYTPIEEVKDGWLALLLDVDNGPSWPTRPQNTAIYTEEGLGKLEGALRPGGVLAVWSAQREVEFVRRMSARFIQVAELVIPIDIGDQAGLDYIYRGRRAAEKRAGGNGQGGKIAQA